MTRRKPERKILEKSVNAEGIQGPLNQRSDFNDAKQTMKRLYDEHTAITGDGKKPIPLGQQFRQRLDQPCEDLEEYDYRLEPRAGWRFLSFLQDDTFIFVIKLATKQRLEMKSELGFVANIILH